VLTGALLGSRLGAITMIIYLLEGAIGLPFFSAGTAAFFI
jgi:biotin transport system substrate-specific component